MTARPRARRMFRYIERWFCRPGHWMRRARRAAARGTFGWCRDGHLAGNYYRRLLYGGAVLVTLALLAAVAVSVKARVDRFIDDRRHLFFEQANDVQAEVELAESRLRTLVAQHKARWELWGRYEPHAAMASQYRELLDASHGFVLSDKALSAAPYVVVSTLPADATSLLARMGRILRDISAVPAGYAAGGPGQASFVYDGSQRFFAFGPAFDVSDVLRVSMMPDLRSLALKETAGVERAISALPIDHLTLGQIVWVPPHRSLISGEQVLQYAVALTQAQARVAVIGFSVAQRHFSSTFMTRGGGLDDFAVLAAGDAAPLGLIQGVHGSSPLLSAALRDTTLTEASGPAPRLIRRGGAFFFTQRIDGPGWVALHAFDWKTILRELRPELAVLLSMAAGVLAMLWALAVVLDRCIIAPVQRKRWQTQRLLVEAARAAGAANHAKSMFLASMSHEIRTPLHAALGNLELLRMQSMAPAQRDLAETIQCSFGTLKRLLDDILDFSKIEAGELRLDIAPFDPTDLAEHCARAIAPTLVCKQVHFLLLCDPALPPRMLGDAMRVQQILMNLLNNAAKFTAVGRVALHVSSFDDAQARRWLRFEVIDSGIGIAPQDQQRLFSPFTQVGASTARCFGGTGLGLSLCRRLAELMNGRITVASTPGVGSVFTVDLPMVLPADAFADPPSPSSLPSPLPPVVVQCLQREWRDQLATRLAAWGASVQAIDAPEALRHVNGGGRDAMVVAAHTGNIDLSSLRAALGDARCIVALSERHPTQPEMRDGVWVASSLSRQSLWLALDKAADTVGRATPLPMHAEPVASPPPLPEAWRGARVLLVEDDDVARTLLRKQLGVLGFDDADDIDDAPDGASALACCRERRYAMILTDLHMPDMRGTALLQRLRQAGVDTPVVLISAGVSAGRLDRGKGGAEGFDDTTGFADVLEKPVSIAQLRALFERLCPGISGDMAGDDALDATPVDDMPPALADAADALWRIFARTWPRDLKVLEASLADGDAGAFQRRVHKVKGSLLMLSDKPLAALCARIEQVCREGGLNAVHGPFHRLARRVAERLEMRVNTH